MESEKNEGWFGGAFKWKMGKEELKKELDAYNSKSIFGSIRKIAAFIIILSIIISIILIGVGWLSPETWVDIIIMAILSIFIYKGKKWAMIVVMILWTASSGFKLINSFSADKFNSAGFVIIIIFWALFMKAFSGAYQVEKARQKAKLEQK